MFGNVSFLSIILVTAHNDEHLSRSAWLLFFEVRQTYPNLHIIYRLIKTQVHSINPPLCQLFATLFIVRNLVRAMSVANILIAYKQNNK